MIKRKQNIKRIFTAVVYGITISCLAQPVPQRTLPDNSPVVGVYCVKHQREILAELEKVHMVTSRGN